jgi:hypothetical protein
MPELMTRMEVLEEQMVRHKAKISMCLEQLQAGADGRWIRTLAERLSRVEREMESERFYREGEEIRCRGLDSRIWTCAAISGQANGNRKL